MVAAHFRQGGMRPDNRESAVLHQMMQRVTVIMTTHRNDNDPNHSSKDDEVTWTMPHQLYFETGAPLGTAGLFLYISARARDSSPILTIGPATSSGQVGMM